MNELSQGLAISIAGLTITFLALGVFILVMLLLQRIFPSKPEVAEETSEDTDSTIEKTEYVDNQEIAAAIAVAINYFRSMAQSELGESLQQGHGPWWVSNRISARQSPGQRINRSSKL